MNKLLNLVALAALWSVGAVAQTIPLYTHNGANIYRMDKFEQAPPTIDATAFVNYGTFVITNVIDYELYPLYALLELPYEPNNMVNFTNRNRMSGLFGFRFNNASDTGRSRMGTFLNENGATIDAVGGVIGENPTVPDTGFFTNILYLANSYLHVNATNIINRGVLRSDNQGLIHLEGHNVDLTRGAVLVRPAQTIYEDFLFGCYDGGTKSWSGTNYWPDVGITDYHWCRTGYEENREFIPALCYFPYFGGAAAVSGEHRVRGLQPPYFQEILQWIITDPLSAVYALDVDGGGTNFIIQAVFVNNLDTNVFMNVSFGPSSSPTNPWTSPCIEFTALQPNPVTGGNMVNRLYIMDYLMSETNNMLQYNVDSGNVQTFCPGNYVVSRTPPCEFLAGRAGNVIASPDLFYNNTYSNYVVTNFQTAYAFRMTNVSATTPGGVSITNQGSRIEIVADQLKMDRVRISSEGYVSINAAHLLSSTNATIEVEYLDLNLGSTNGNLQLRGLVADSVTRFGGFAQAYSAAWTNYTGEVITNEVDDGNGGLTNELVTNVITLMFHVFMVDGDIGTRYPLNILNLRTRGTNTEIGDVLSVSDILQMDAEDLTIAQDGVLNIRRPIGDWSINNFPNLIHLTNLGAIVVSNAAFFGADGPRPYQTLINKGSIQAVSEHIRSEYFENAGLLSSVQIGTNLLGSTTNFGAIHIEAGTAKLEGGSIECGVDLTVEAGDLKFRNHSSLIRGTLNLTVTNSLSDSGATANNVIEVGNGFHLARRPAGGDLLGSSIRTVAAPFNYILHTWTATDRGAVPAGFQDNAALGRLVVDGAAEGFFNFAGGEAASAFYVDYLELRGSAAFVEEAVNVDPNLTIYFADSNESPETLDGKLGGRLRWVKDFAGPNSSVDVEVAGGGTVKMNRALRASAAYDSDNDGIANGFDPLPLTPDLPVRLAAVTFTNVPPLQPLLQWEALPLSVMQLESSATLPATSWQVLYKHTNDTFNSAPVQFIDPTPLGAGRYYRLRYSQ